MPRILIVDDDPCTRATIAEERARPHRMIATPVDGEEALALAHSFVPNLILTGVVMPKLDGWEFLDSLRASHETANVPTTPFLMEVARLQDEARHGKSEGP